MPTRPYTFFEMTISICSQCYQKVDAKIIFQSGCVYMLKHCLKHGCEKVLISTDIDYYKKCREFNKPGDMPYKFNTPIRHGCPYDCGLCPDHEQHSCVTLVELTDRCNLSCPTCYASSSPSYGSHRSFEHIKSMIDIVVANERQPDVVQLSGGEPTLHPNFFDVVAYCKHQPIQHLMINTNGIRIAQDENFVKRLAEFQPGFEVYLQFDSFKPSVLQQLRGKDLTTTRKRAIEHLNKYNISTTLVVTLQNALNIAEIGTIINYAVQQPCIRGVTFQPTQEAGRLENYHSSTDRITLAAVRQEILKQTSLFSADDLIPVPCHPDAIAMGYAVKINNQTVPLTRYFSPEDLMATSRNTITFEKLPELPTLLKKIFSTGSPVEGVVNPLQKILCCLPKINAPTLTYTNLFRVIIMQFYDAQNFDLRGVKKSCVHIVHQDGRIIPFDTMNLFYRNPDQERLQALPIGSRANG